MPSLEAVLVEVAGIALSAIAGKYRRHKEYLGEFTMRDQSYGTWEVKVRIQDKRGKYLKLERVTGQKLKFRASADNYKLYDKYLPITEAEWIAFAEYAQTRDSRLLPCMEDVLTQLASKAHLVES